MITFHIDGEMIQMISTVPGNDEQGIVIGNNWLYYCPRLQQPNSLQYGSDVHQQRKGIDRIFARII